MATRAWIVMDADGHGIVVGVVGFSMALMGFVMSLIAPVVQNFYPRTQVQLPALITAHQGQRHARRRLEQATAPPAIEAQKSVSPSGSVDSVVTALSSAASSSTTATSVLSASSPRAEASRNGKLASDSTVKSAGSKAASSGSPCTPRACIARVARMRSKSRSRAKRAGSAPAATSSPIESADIPQESIVHGRISDSPASSTFNLTARSSSEIDVNYILAPSSPTRSLTNDSKEDKFAKEAERHRPRPLIRAKTFFNLGRSSSKRRKDGPPAAESLPLHPSRAATIDEAALSPSSLPPKSRISLSRHIPFPSTRTSHEKMPNDRRSVDEQGVLKERMPRVKSLPSSRLAKLHREDESRPDSAQEPPTDVPALPAPSTLVIAHEARSEEITPTRRRICSRTRSERPTSICVPLSTENSNSSKKHSKKSSSPPRRTRPYEAPYFFPMPTSPDAIDYARRTRSEYAQAHSGLAQDRAGIAQARNPAKGGSAEEKPKSKDEFIIPEPKTAPAHRIGFHFPLHFHRSHTRAASLSSPISPPRSPEDEVPEADELGFVCPSQDIRMRKPIGENVALST